MLGIVTLRRGEAGKPLGEERLHGHDAGDGNGGVCLDAGPKSDGDVGKGVIRGVDGKVEHNKAGDRDEADPKRVWG